MLRLSMPLILVILCGWNHCNLAHAQQGAPTISDDRAFHLTVMGGFYPEDAKAMESALEEAQQRLMAIFLEHGIQISPIPELKWIEKNLVMAIRREQQRFEELGSPELVRISLDLRISPERWRSLRKTENTFVGGLTFLLVFLGFLLSRLYYRLDDWSKGFLTRWLAVGVALILTCLGGIYLWLRS